MCGVYAGGIKCLRREIAGTEGWGLLGGGGLGGGGVGGGGREAPWLSDRVLMDRLYFEGEKEGH